MATMTARCDLAFRNMPSGEEQKMCHSRRERKPATDKTWAIGSDAERAFGAAPLTRRCQFR